MLTVDNATETAEYYQDKLGFTISFLWGEPPYYAIVGRDDIVSLHFSEREDTTKPIAPSHVYVFVADVNAVYEEYKAKGLKIFSPPEDQEYGMREFEIVDPNGHFLTFGQGIAEEDDDED